MVVKRPTDAAAAEPVSARKWRRDNADMLAFSPEAYFYEGMMRPMANFRKRDRVSDAVQRWRETSS